MIKYFIKYYLYNGSTKLFRSSFILPFLTVIVGCFVMMMSFAIMEGFSKKISDSIYFFDSLVASFGCCNYDFNKISIY